MEFFDNAEYLAEEIEFAREQGMTIGFVPTMGALHDGHLSLIRRSKSETGYTVASIFVNPTQFNNADDLKFYPRTPDADIRLLEKEATDLLFAPAESEIYPDEKSRTTFPQVNLGALDRVMEAAHRPGHFRGVMQVVHRLFDIVKPDVAYFGEKDYQQLAVIRTMVDQLDLPVQIIGCPTRRESDGLAMSSRNLRLAKHERKEAAVIHRALQFVRNHWQKYSVSQLIDEAIRMIEGSGMIKVEYLQLVDAATLQRVESIDDAAHIRCFVAATIGKVRLIDNEIVRLRG
jgi:pantoate--beta-alanine ligase